MVRTKNLLGATTLCLLATNVEAQLHCERPPVGSWLYVRGYEQVELEPMPGGWWRAWWLAPDGAVRVVAMQPLDDGSGCYAWHLLPPDLYTIEDLVAAGDDGESVQ
jgi:hypothetical protein